MREFKNENVKKEYHKIIRNLIIGVILLALAVVFKVIEIRAEKKAVENIEDLNSIIVSEGDKEEKKSYLNVKSKPYQFAVYDDITDSYYMVSDGKYLYVVYMGVGDAARLTNDDIKDNPIRVEGITKYTTKDVKELAIEAYNDNMENEEDKLTVADFDNYFGSVYLDMTDSITETAALPLGLFFLSLIFGGLLFAIELVYLIRYKSSINNLDSIKVEELDREMNDKDAFYYEKAHLYLTNNYIINFAGTFKAINYKNVVWMYPFVQRTNGVKSSQSIKIMTDEAKTYTIATIDVITKKSKEAYTEIWNTIVSKNDRIVTGYTKENIKAMNDKYKKKK